MQAQLSGPTGVVVGKTGNVLIADTFNNRVREVVKATGLIATVAGNGTAGYNGDGILAASAELNGPGGVAVSNPGDIFIADFGNNRVREVSRSTGLISTVAGNGTAGYNGDGIPAASAELNGPGAVALDNTGNLYIADGGNNRVREVNKATGLITTVAGSGTTGYNGDNIPATSAELSDPQGVAVDGAGNIFIADGGNNLVREVIRATGLITTVAGTGTAGYNGDNIPATSADLSLSAFVPFLPLGIAVDGPGNLFIVDTGNDRVREVVRATGMITTVAGTGQFGYSGDNIPATSAELSAPAGVALDRAGNLFIADVFNSRVRVVAGTTR
jgi:sugar lactone lactonase YvrE